MSRPALPVVFTRRAERQLAPNKVPSQIEFRDRLA
jgi:hypothetical protein